MESQKLVNLLNSSENEYSKFATKKWYVIDSESKGNYSHHDPITFLTKSIESSLCDYSDAYILVTGDIAVTRTIAAAGNNPPLPSPPPAPPPRRRPPPPPLPQRKQQYAAFTQVAFKNCTSFKDCRTEINDTFADYADFINITMPM